MEPHKLGLICEPLAPPAAASPQGREPGLICEPLEDRAGAGESGSDLTIAGLDARRRRHGISLNRLLAAAGGNRDTWFNARAGRTQPRPATLQRYADALDRMADTARARRPPQAIAALVRAVEEMLRAATVNGRGKLKKQLLGRINPRRGGKPVQVLLASRLHAIAIYLVAVELELANVEIARALGCKRQNVRQMRHVIEDLRDDAVVDALFVKVAEKLQGY